MRTQRSKDMSKARRSFLIKGSVILWIYFSHRFFFFVFDIVTALLLQVILVHDRLFIPHSTWDTIIINHCTFDHWFEWFEQRDHYTRSDEPTLKVAFGCPDSNMRCRSAWVAKNISYLQTDVVYL